MPTYVYENEAGARFEIAQRMADAPLTRHPDTGERIHRVPAPVSVITGGAAAGADCPAEQPGPCGMGACGRGACAFGS